MRSRPPPLRAVCACGKVVVEGAGDPIGCGTCYCDDCQAGARQIEALPGAPLVAGSDAGTELVVFREDRVRCTQGAELLRPLKIRPGSATTRFVASCCNSAMFLGFDDFKHWRDIFRARIADDPPPLQMRICTRFAPDEAAIPDDLPRARGYPFSFLTALLLARLRMLFRR